MDQQFDEIDQQNGLSSSPEHTVSPTTDPIAVAKEGEDSLEDEAEYTPDPDDFPGTLYDLLDEVDDVIEVSWTKSPSVTKNNKFNYPLHSFKVITPVYLVLNHSFPSLKCILCYINIEISGELRQTNITSCLVVVRLVDSACFIVYAILKILFISSSVDNDLRRDHSNRRLKKEENLKFQHKIKKMN